MWWKEEENLGYFPLFLVWGHLFLLLKLNEVSLMQSGLLGQVVLRLCILSYCNSIPNFRCIFTSLWKLAAAFTGCHHLLMCLPFFPSEALSSKTSFQSSELWNPFLAVTVLSLPGFRPLLSSFSSVWDLSFFIGIIQMPPSQEPLFPALPGLSSPLGTPAPTLMLLEFISSLFLTFRFVLFSIPLSVGVFLGIFSLLVALSGH